MWLRRVRNQRGGQIILHIVHKSSLRLQVVSIIIRIVITYGELLGGVELIRNEQGSEQEAAKHISQFQHPVFLQSDESSAMVF
jgi:hypothetical protein